MRNIYSIVIVALILVSCGNNKTQTVEELVASENLELIRERKSKLDANQQELDAQIKLLEARIKDLDPQAKIPLVTTYKVKDTIFNHHLELQGSVNTKQNLVIFPEFSGILTKVYVKEGQLVKKGQLLAKIDDGGLSQQVAQLQIQANLAKTTFERQERLWQQKIGSEIQYLQAKSSYESQQKAVNQFQQQIAKTAVRAPFSGTIDDVITEQGSVVGAGQTQLFRIVNLKNMYIETDVPERYISSVTKGKTVAVEFPILDKKLNATIRQAGYFINAANRTFKIEVAIPNQDQSIKPNLTAKLKINDYTNPAAVLIPQSIISENADGEQYVYIIRDKKENKAVAKRAIIGTGKTQGDLIEVLTGLQDGDELIEEGSRSVKEGQEVKISGYVDSKN